MKTGLMISRHAQAAAEAVSPAARQVHSADAISIRESEENMIFRKFRLKNPRRYWWWRGPGGMMAAVTAAERGHQVTVWEADKKIGGQLNLAVVAPGKQEMTKWMVHLNYRAKKAGVTFEFGKTGTVEAVREFAPDAVIVATGARL